MGDPPRFLSSFFTSINKGRSNRKKQTRFQNPVALPEEIHHQFSLSQIKAATNNFHPDLILGEGGFGTVYKGFFNDGKLVVVKRAKPESEPGARHKEFRTELVMLSQLRHQHLVPLVGFCFEKGEMILLYEYMNNMRNGSLPDLYGSGYDPLPWKQRLEICIGAARGLHYLHNGAKRPIIHGNVKSRNILLADKWVCKLADFRTSKLRRRGDGKTKASEKIDPLVQSNLGYLDPEYLETAQLEEKCDVYSFGVVLFEVLCARRPFVEHEGETTTTLVDLACQSINEGTIDDMIDPYLKGRIAPACFKLFVDTASSCTRVVGDSRPEMGEVEAMLERALELQEKADSDPLHNGLP